MLITALISLISVSQLEIHGHRGARWFLPENTLPAFEYALENGADVLEMDAVVTADDVLVIHHDLKIDSQICRNKDGSPVKNNLWIRSLTFEQVKAFDCGSQYNSEFPKQKKIPGVKIPSLLEVFEWVKASKSEKAAQIRFNIEAKSLPGEVDHSPNPSFYARLLVDLIKLNGFESRTIIQSFDHRILKEVKELNPKISTSALIAQNYLIDLVRVARLAGADIVSPNADWITTDQIRTLRATGIKVIPWTVNEPAGWERFANAGVDGLITDNPKELKAFLDSRIKKD